MDPTRWVISLDPSTQPIQGLEVRILPPQLFNMTILTKIKNYFRTRKQNKALKNYPNMVQWATMNSSTGEQLESFGVIGPEDELLDFSGKTFKSEEM